MTEPPPLGQTHPPLGAARAGTRRLVGVDLARAVALLGMLAVHFVGTVQEPPGKGVAGPASWSLAGLADGRSMPLFVMLSGIGMSLLLRSRSGRPAAVLGRATVLLLLGLLLTGWTLVDVILQFYALYMVVGLLANRLRDRALLGLAAVLAVGGVAFQIWRTVHPSTGSGDFIAPGSPLLAGLESLSHPVTLLRGLLFTGGYPLLPDGALFVGGMWIGRRSLTEARAARWLVGTGLLLVAASFAVVAVVGQFRTDATNSSQAGTGQVAAGQVASGTEAAAPQATREGAPDVVGSVPQVTEGVPGGGDLIGEKPAMTTYQSVLEVLGDSSPHSHTPVWLLDSLGWAMVVLGLCLGASRWGRWLQPFARLGAMTLTGYVAHILFLRWGGVAWWADRPTLMAVAVFLVILGFAALWTRFFHYGPVEATLRQAGALAARAADVLPRRRLPGRQDRVTTEG